MNKPILVTGGAGYIGSHSCKALHSAGFIPVVLDNFDSGSRDAVKWGPLEEADINERNQLDCIFEKYSFHAVMHFAAHCDVGESAKNPGKYYQTNVTGTLNLLEAMHDFGVKRLVFSSTCATYGVTKQNPINEATAQLPNNPYGWSKLMAERLISDIGSAHGLEWITCRYFNAAGADQELQIGEMPATTTRLIPTIFEIISNGSGKVTIFGADYDTPDGSCIRDYVHVDDLAAAHVMAFSGLEGGHAFGAYNLGTGRGFSVFEVIKSVERVTGIPVPVEVGPRRFGDPAEMVCDAGHARADFGWSAAIVDLDKMVKSAWDWHQKQKSN